MTRIRFAVLGIAFVVAAILPATAVAAPTTVGYIFWPGGDPEAGQVPISSYSWSVSQSGQGPRGALRPKVKEFELTKGITSGSPRYVYDTAIGKTLPSVRIDLADTPLAYCLSSVQITHVRQSADNDVPLEDVSLDYRKISVQFNLNTKGGGGGVPVVTIDLNHGTVSFGSTSQCPALP
jgi:type VI protein secretion system component Hcp